MHADGYALAPGPPDAEAAGAGPGHGLRRRRRLVAKLADYQPPWEIETSFIAPDDTVPWNYWMNFIVVDKQGKNLGMWTPGVENDPKAKRHRPLSGATFKLAFRTRGPRVDPGHKPLSMLIQCLDDSHVRLGFRGSRTILVLSEVFDVEERTGRRDRRVRHALLEHDHRPHVRCRPGGPMYQKFLIDYVHYRYGLSAP